MTERILVQTNEKIKHRIRPKDTSEHRFLTDGKQGPEGIQGVKGDSAYKIALDNGFNGSKDDWLASLVGDDAYEVALNEGFVGTRQEWLESLIGKDAYEIALDNGFVGSKEDWLEYIKTPEFSSTDSGKFLTNDGNNLYWQSITKQFLNLGNVDNTADIDKPVSTAQQEALDYKLDKAEFRPYLESEINNTNNILLLDHGEF